MAAPALEPIHILGVGNLGKLVAHSLAASPRAAPVTLLFHRQELADEWAKAGRSIDVVKKGKSDRRGGFEIEAGRGSEGLIRNLVVATKTYATVDAIKPLRNRLNSDSTVMFLQNGMGTVEEVTRSFFAARSARPHYLAGIVSHGVYRTGPFSIVHAGLGNIIMGPVKPLQEPIAAGLASVAEPPRYLLDCLSASPGLSASVVPPVELLLAQLEKLAINAVINPLTVIFDCKNGHLYGRQPIRVLIQVLIKEISAIIQMLIQSVAPSAFESAALLRFSPESLERTVSTVAEKTGQNISSMRQDAQAGRMTEIDCINGYLVARGSESGISCRLNQILVQMVRERRTISDAQISGTFNL